MIYTSGSTGRPKGVAVPHGAVASFLGSMAEAPGLGRGDRLVAVTTLSFDIAVLELLLPLSVGATVELASRAEASDPAALAALVERCGATAMQATPSAWRGLVEWGWRGRAGTEGAVRRRGAGAGAGGGAGGADRRAVEPLRADRDHDLVGAGAGAGDGGWGRGPPGSDRPADRRDRLLRARPGAGASAARRVRARSTWAAPGWCAATSAGPGLTAERFLPDPFAEEPGARMYATGDRARWRADGAARVPRPARPAGQGPRPPDRAGRDRGRPRRPPGGSRPPRWWRRRWEPGRRVSAWSPSRSPPAWPRASCGPGSPPGCRRRWCRRWCCRWRRCR